MKPLHSILVLCVAFALTGVAAFADPADCKPATCKPATAPKAAPCGCEVKADAKVCGVDTDCCCTGEKAKGRAKEKKVAKDACSDGKCDVKCDDTAKAARERPAYGKVRR